MAHLGFNQRDINNLVNKLDRVMGELTDQERMLLVAIFKAAASQAERSNENESLLPALESWGQGSEKGTRREYKPTKEELKRQLRNGYIPGKNVGTPTHSTYKVVGPRTNQGGG